MNGKDVDSERQSYQVGIVPESLRQNIKPRAYLRVLLWPAVTGFIVQGVQLIWSIRATSQTFPPTWNLFAQLAVTLVFVMIAFVISASVYNGGLVKGVAKLDTDLTEAYKRSFPLLRDLLDKMASRARDTQFTQQDVDSKVQMDGKLFLALSYGERAISRRLPTVKLDVQYIQDVFDSYSSTYTLWTEEPSTWLDPMMQFYLVNLCLNSLARYEGSLERTKHPLEVHDRSATGYVEFEQLRDRLVGDIADGRVPNGAYSMIRIVLLKHGWETHYKDELAVLAAICESFRIPCLFIKEPQLRHYLSEHAEAANAMRFALDEMRTLVKQLLPPLVAVDVASKFVYTEDRLALMGLLILDETKCYLFTESGDPAGHFTAIEDTCKVTKRIFELLVRAYRDDDSCRFLVTCKTHVNSKHSILAASGKLDAAPSSLDAA